MKDKVLNDREQILKFNTMIKSENDRMNKYVERILQQAKLDRRELQINKTEVDINEMVREAAEHLCSLSKMPAELWSASLKPIISSVR